jgi:ribosome-associated protein
LTSRTLAKKISQFALEKKAADVLIMDLRKITTTADFFVLCSADSDTQVRAIAESILEGTERLGAKVWHAEGMSALMWVVLDYVDVVTHIFHKDARSFYNLERLWGDAKITEITDELEKAVRIRRQAHAAKSSAHPRTTRSVTR